MQAQVLQKVLIVHHYTIKKAVLKNNQFFACIHCQHSSRLDRVTRKNLFFSHYPAAMAGDTLSEAHVFLKKKVCAS